LGDDKSYNAILPNSLDAQRSVRATGSCFYSAIRDEALALNCLLETNPDHPQVGILVKHLSEQIKKDSYMNTNERAWAFIALGKFMKRAAASTATAYVMANGTQIAEFKGDDVVLKTKDVANKKIEIKTSGSGNLYFFTEQSGLRFDSKFKEEDNYLMVRKSFYDRFGKPLGNTITQGELVVVKITLYNKQASDIDNVVVTDMLPAGFEIENPRLTEDRDMTWIKGQSTPQHFDVRDDRINLYTNIGRGAENYYYMVRAVSTGSFIMGPVSADAMYNAEYHSYNGAGVVKVVER
jgi:alpha-2-macroglobulin